MEIALPKFHSPAVINWFSIKLPMRKYCPPPKSFGMKKELTAYLENKGYEVNNVDCLLILEKPKMRPYIESIKESVASLLKTDISNVNIKATTNEKMGEIGKEEAIQAHSVILLRKKSV